MEKTVIINEISIQTSKLEIGQLEKNGEIRTILDMEFQVTSEEYHDITVMLYENDFIVQVLEENLEMKATIYKYSTSITNLYQEGNVGHFQLVLLEKE